MGTTLVPMGLWVWIMGKDLYQLGTHAEVYIGSAPGVLQPVPCAYGLTMGLEIQPRIKPDARPSVASGLRGIRHGAECSLT